MVAVNTALDPLGLSANNFCLFIYRAETTLLTFAVIFWVIYYILLY